MLAPRRDAFQGLRNQVAGLASRRINPLQQQYTPQQTPNLPIQTPMGISPEFEKVQQLFREFSTKVENDPNTIAFKERMKPFQEALMQRQQNLFSQVQNLSPELQEVFNLGINVWQQSQPEIREIQKLAQQHQTYVKQTYGAEQQKLMDMQEKFYRAPAFTSTNQTQGIQTAFQQAQGLQNTTPEQFESAMDQAVKESNVKTIFGVQPQNPYTSTTAVDSTGTPVTGIQPAQQQPTVKPITLTPERQEKIKTMVNPQYLDRTPVFKPPTPLNPIKQEPVKPIVDPKIEPARPPIGLATQPTIKPEVDPVVEPVRNRYSPSQYQNLHTNVKGLMR